MYAKNNNKKSRNKPAKVAEGKGCLVCIKLLCPPPTEMQILPNFILPVIYFWYPHSRLQCFQRALMKPMLFFVLLKYQPSKRYWLLHSALHYGRKKRPHSILGGLKVLTILFLAGCHSHLTALFVSE